MIGFIISFVIFALVFLPIYLLWVIATGKESTTSVVKFGVNWITYSGFWYILIFIYKWLDKVS